MSSIYGRKLKISVFGQSHAPAIGVCIDGFPAGFKIDFDKLGAFMARRAPGQDSRSTPRKEADKPEFVSGLSGDGYTCGAPITVLIYNSNTRSSDYSGVSDVPRPSHADYVALMKYGEHNDFAGGGHFSGRLTAPLCIAGALAIGLLEKNGVKISAEVIEVGGVRGNREAMLAQIDKARCELDSVGGIVECRAEGLPVGLGDPIFDGMENRIASAVFGIPAVRGIEFGRGFEAAAMRGSEHNDAYCIENGEVRTKNNNHGGIIGGITTGMPVVFRAAFKPTPSIAREQDSVRLSDMSETKLSVHGRHDPCVALRAVPCVEAACAVAVLDAMLENGAEINV